MKILAITVASAVLLTAIMLACIWVAADTSERDPKGHDEFYD